MKVFLGTDKEEIEIENQPSLGRGGEGEVYKIIAPAKYRNYCIKLYNKPKITPEKIKKLEYLLTHQPIVDNKGHRSVIWIENIAYIKEKNTQNYTFAGIMMHIAEGYSVEYLCANKFPFQRIKINDVKACQKFDRNHPENVKSRLVVCYNIALAIAQLHQNGLYVHADIKPENIIFDVKGKVSIIDFDNVQVIQNGKLLFPALAQTPEYIPPKYQQNNIKNTIFPPFVDIFSITVIFYRILTGIHPFAATNFKAPYQNITDIPSAIQNKLFPFGQNQKYFNQIPAPHQLFHKIPKPLQDLFIQVLEHENTSIKATDWMEAIYPQKPKLHFPKLSLFKPSPSVDYDAVLKYTFVPNPIITLPTYIDTQYDKISWVEENKLKPSLIDMMFRPQKTNLINEVIYLQNACKQLIQNYKELKKKHSNMLMQYASQTKSIAEKSQENYTSLLHQYNYADIDQLYTQYTHKIHQKLEQWLLQKTEQIPKIQSLYSNYFKNLETLNIREYSNKVQHLQAIQHLIQSKNLSFEQAKEHYISLLTNAHQEKIIDLQNQIKNLRKDIDTKLWQSHPWVQEQCENTFLKDAPLPSLIITKLTQAGFNTAADIVDIDKDGRILNKKDQFVKVPQIGFTRANEVWTWKDELLKKIKKTAKQQNIDLTNFDTPEIIAVKGEIDTLNTEFDFLIQQLKNIDLHQHNTIEQITTQFWNQVFALAHTTLEDIIEPEVKQYRQLVQKYDPEPVLQRLKHIIDSHNEKQLEIKLYYEHAHQDYTKEKTNIENKIQENLTRLKELWKKL